MSERRLSEIAKVLRQPEGIVGSEFTRINKAARKAGIRFDLWQQGFLWLLFAKNTEGKYACGADGAVLSSCRQIGKTFTVGTALFLKAILTPNLKAIWTAHHTRTSDETFADMCEMEHNPVLGRYVERIRRANGQQEITFTSGSRIMFGARENGFGRGLHSVDVAVFDEAQILTVRAMDNMIPVLNTSPNPLVVYMGNPPKPGDQCDAFTEKRMHALNHDGNLLYVELAADKDADSDDREQWAKANPSYPKRTSEQAIMRMRNNLSDDSFRREALGIWDETATAYAISPDLWQAAAVDDVPEGGTVSFGIDMPPDRSVLTIGAALRYADGFGHRPDGEHQGRAAGGNHVGRGLARRTLAEDRQRGHRRAVARHEPAAGTEESTCEGHGHEHAGDGPSMRPVPRHAQSRNAQAPAGRIPAAAGRGRQGCDHASIGTVRRDRLEQTRQ